MEKIEKMDYRFNALKRDNHFDALKCENRTLYFDMDGTIADLYGYTGWLDKLEAEDPAPYAEAMPLYNTIELTSLLLNWQARGGKIGIVSWLSKTSSPAYDKAVRLAKRNWLKENLSVKFNEIHIVKYGTPKWKVVKDRQGFLFDDEKRNGDNWKGVAVDVTKIDIIEFLQNLLDR